MNEPRTARERTGCGPLVALVVIAFFVNVPLVHDGWGGLWDVAPALVAVALVVDLFLAMFVVLWWWRRFRRD